MPPKLERQLIFSPVCDTEVEAPTSSYFLDWQADWSQEYQNNKRNAPVEMSQRS